MMMAQPNVGNVAGLLGSTGAQPLGSLPMRNAPVRSMPRFSPSTGTMQRLQQAMPQLMQAYGGVSPNFFAALQSLFNSPMPQITPTMGQNIPRDYSDARPSRPTPMPMPDQVSPLTLEQRRAGRPTPTPMRDMP